MKKTIPKSFPLMQSFNQMKEGEEKGLIKLFEIAYVPSVRGRPFTDFSNLVEFERLYGMKVLEKYKTELHVKILFLLQEINLSQSLLSQN